MSYGSMTVSVPRSIAPDMSQAQTVQQQLAATRDPAMRQRLMIQAALEARYARDMAAAQNQVQGAATTPGADIVYGGNAAQMRAMDARRRMVQQAALRYNQGLGAGPMEARKPTTDWSY